MIAMFKSTKEFDGAVKDILVYVRDGKDMRPLHQKYGKANFNQACERCYREGFLEGIGEGGITNDGVRHYSGGTVISNYGLQFIERG